MQLEVCRRHRHEYSCHAAKCKGTYKTQEPIHRCCKNDPAPKHRTEPIEYLHTSGDGNNHSHNSKKSIHVSTGAHGKEMMKPDYHRKECDTNCCSDQRCLAKEPFLRKRRNNFRINSEGRENKHVHFRMSPRPDKIGIHHR